MPIERRTHQLCYIRRGDALRGPFPIKQIRRDWLLGRITDADEVGCNNRGWQKVSAFIASHPDQSISRLAYVDDEELDRLRRSIDERRGFDRRDREGEVPEEIKDRRRSSERRLPESAQVVDARLRRYNTFQGRHRAYRGYALALGIVLSVLLAAGGWLAWETREVAVATAERSCIAPPAPRVNWSTCNLAGLKAPDALLQGANLHAAKLPVANLRGADLSRADLSYADLSGADISYADLADANLTGAQLGGANLSYSSLGGAILDHADLRGAQLNFVSLAGTRLSRTIWTDGRICDEGSRGQCLRSNE